MAPQQCRLEVYKRSDGKWAWRLRGRNGGIIATDGSQGYENKSDCQSMGEAIKSGNYAECPVVEL